MTTTITTSRNWEDSVGTSLQGYVDTTYERLVDRFGEPTVSDPSGSDKVQYEWILHTPAGIATVYDWKNYDTDGRLTTDWHIGGRDEAVVSIVQAALH